MSKFKVGDKITRTIYGNIDNRQIMAEYDHKYVLRNLSTEEDWIHNKQAIDFDYSLLPNEIIVGNSYKVSMKLRDKVPDVRVIGICKDNDTNYITYIQHCTHDAFVRTETQFRNYYDV